MADTATVEIILKLRDELSKGLSGVGGSLKGFGQQATKLGKSLTAGVTLPLVAIGTASVKMATDMDREMRNIQSISKATDATIAALSETFVDMSTDLTVTTDSAVRLAEGFYTIQGSGFAGADAMTVLEASTKAASAGLTNTQVAAKGIAAALNAYGLSADQAAAYSDLMFRTVDIGVGTFEELSSSLGYVVGTASQAGIGFDEVSAALSTASKQGIEFYKGARALNMLMLALIKPSEEMAIALEELGFRSGQAALDALGLAGTLQALEAAGHGGTEGFAALGLSSMALRSALSLTGTGAQTFTEDLAAMQRASEGAGATQEAFAIQTQSFSAQLANFKNIIQAAGITLGNVLLPVLSDLIKQVTPLIQRFTELDPKVLQIILVVGGLAAALGPLLMIVGQVATGLSALMPILAALTGPIGLVVAAIGLLAVAWAKDWGGIREKTQEVVDKIKTFITDLRLGIEALMYNMKDDIERIKTFFVDLRLDLEVFIYNLPNYIQDIIKWFQELPGKIWNAVKEIGSSIINGIREGLARFWPQLKKDVEDIIAAIVGAFKTTLGIGSASTEFAEVGQNIMQGLEQGMATATPGVRAMMQEIAWALEATLAANLKAPEAAQYGATYLESLAAGLEAGSVKAYDQLIDLRDELLAATADIGSRQMINWFETAEAQAMLAAGTMAPHPLGAFEHGGIVPGRGPRLAVVHGGETITPAGGGGSMVIEVPVYLDGREIARVISPHLGEEYRRERGLRV